MTLQPDTLFISHANPTDNEPTLWLASRLSLLGYRVWADVFNLSGGEYTWREIEEVLRNRTCVFLYLFSNASKLRSGVRDEIELAKVLEKERGEQFILPVKIDQTSFGDLPVGLTGKNAKSMADGWAKGLDEIVQYLEKHNVPTQTDASAVAERAWIRAVSCESSEIVQRATVLWTNFFPLEKTPVLHTYEHDNFKGEALSNLDASFVWSRKANHLATFASPQYVAQQLPQYALKHVESKELGESLSDGNPFKARSAARELLRKAWGHHIQSLSGPTYEFVSRSGFRKSQAVMFTPSFVGDGRIKSELDTIAHRRSLNGKSGKIGDVVRRWVYGAELEAQVHPNIGYSFYPRVGAYKEGSNADDALAFLDHQRNSVTASWYNATWRDRMLVAMEVLSDHQPVLRLRTGSDQSIDVQAVPRTIQVDFDYDVRPTATKEASIRSEEE